ncbi:unnamed protein product, partial [Cylicocyclus nassatus]
RTAQVAHLSNSDRPNGKSGVEKIGRDERLHYWFKYPEDGFYITAVKNDHEKELHSICLC